MNDFIGNILFLVLLTSSMEVSRAQKVFKSINRNSFYVEPEKQYNWFQANAECTRRNMALLTIDSPEKDKEISQLLKDIYKGQTQPAFYIGAQDLGTFRKFVWISSGKPFQYTNWEDNALNSKSKANDHCVLIGLRSSNKWNVMNCTRRYGFICEVGKGA